MPIRTGSIPSHVIAIIPTADRSKATVKVRIGLDAKDARIVPGHGRAGVVPRGEEARPAQAQERPRGVLVPAAAHRARTATRTSCSSLKDGKAQRRTVTLGGTLGDSRQVLSRRRRRRERDRRSRRPSSRTRPRDAAKS